MTENIARARIVDFSGADGIAPPHNLPSQLTSFIGRARELGQMQQLLAEHRLVTLVGPGGVGKSRLAVETAQRMLRSFPDGTWLVDLSGLGAPDLVPRTLAATLGVSEGPTQPLEEALSTALRHHRCLLVLDNCEHLVDACAQLTRRLARECPDVRVLITSQEPLRITGEALLRVAPLAVPGPGERDPRRIRQTDSARLFAERAHEARLGFELGDDTVAPVAEICRRLNGVPLALELAAARLRTMPLGDIAAGLDRRFQVLSTGDRTAPARQQSLQAMVEWSTDMLDTTQQTVLRRLSVFSGGWTREAASQICSDARLGPAEVVQALDDLVERSLVVLDDWRGQPRYRLLETIRAFGLERLHETGEERSSQHRHQNWYLGMLERSFDDMLADEAEWLHRMDVELDNVRAALDFCQIDPSTAERAAYAAFGLWAYTDSRGGVPEMTRRLTSLISLLPGDQYTPGRLLCQALLCHGLGAQNRIEEAIPRFLEALEHEAEVEDSWARGWLRAVHIMWLTVQGDAKGVAMARESLAQEPYCSFRMGPAYWQWLQGEALVAVNALAEAQAPLQVAARDLPWQRLRALPLRDLGIIAFNQGDLEGAQRQIRASLEAIVPSQDLRHIGVCLEQLACVASAMRQHARCACLLGAATMLFERAGTHTLPTWQLDRDESEQASRAQLGEDEFRQLWSSGQGMTMDRAVKYALEDVDDSVTEPVSGAWSRLTRRERQTALRVAQGLTNREIADAHVVSVKTVESHITSALAKLGLRSRAQLVAWVTRHQANRDLPA